MTANQRAAAAAPEPPDPTVYWNYLRTASGEPIRTQLVSPNANEARDQSRLAPTEPRTFLGDVESRERGSLERGRDVQS